MNDFQFALPAMYASKEESASGLGGI